MKTITLTDEQAAILQTAISVYSRDNIECYIRIAQQDYDTAMRLSETYKHEGTRLRKQMEAAEQLKHNLHFQSQYDLLESIYNNLSVQQTNP